MSKPTPTPPPAEALDARVRRSRQAVLAETFKLLSESGLGGVSVDEVARRSGVAKTTIYRHWPSRTALVLDACSQMAARPDLPETGDLRTDLMTVMSYVARRLQTNRWSSVLPSIIDAAERDAEVAALHASLHKGFMQPLLAVVEHAQRRGDLPRDRKPTEFVARLVGPLFYRRWFSREPLDKKFLEHLVESVSGVEAGGRRR